MAGNVNIRTLEAHDTQQGTARHGTAQHSRAQHSAAQQGTGGCNPEQHGQ